MSTKTYRIGEAARRYRVEEYRLIHFIEAHWVAPVHPDSLDEEDMARIRLILDLQDTFGVNAAAIPIILHLLDQLVMHRMDLDLEDRD